MSANKTAAPKVATHPVRPRPTKLNIAAAHKALSKRYRKVLAALAK